LGKLEAKILCTYNLVIPSSSLISAASGGILETTSTIMKNMMKNENDGGGIMMSIGEGSKLIKNESSEINTVRASNGNGGGL
jgi:hypothetical protein